MESNTQQFFEAAMMVCFGTSWPFSILKTWRTKTSKGKSFLFLSLLILGYISGMVSKLAAPEFQWVFFFYLANCLMVSFDLCLCIKYWMRENQIYVAGEQDKTD